MSKQPIRVCVTGAAGQIGYSLIPRIARGDMFGPDQPVILHLLDIPPALGALGGVVLEIEDMAAPLVAGVVATAEPDVGFKDVDVAILVGSFPRKEGMERKDLLAKNCGIFKVQGASIEKVAKKTVKVLVVGNPANTNCKIARAAAPTLPDSAFSALTRLDHNRALSAIARKLAVPVGGVKNVVIWGNHSSTQFPDASSVVVNGTRPSLDPTWLRTDFLTGVRGRGAAIVAARKLSSALSAANAIVDHVRDWVYGTPAGEHVSMGVVAPADNGYGVKAGLVFSFPVTCAGGAWTIVPGLPVDDFAKEKLKETEQELQEEWDTAAEILRS